MRVSDEELKVNAWRAYDESNTPLGAAGAASGSALADSAGTSAASSP
jgi:hypothetical protein